MCVFEATIFPNIWMPDTFPHTFTNLLLWLRQFLWCKYDLCNYFVNSPDPGRLQKWSVLFVKDFFFFFQIDLMIKKRRCSFSPKRSFVWLQLLAFVGHHDFSITLTEVSVFCTGTASSEQKCGYITSYKINKTRQQKKTKNNTIMIFSTLSYA